MHFWDIYRGSRLTDLDWNNDLDRFCSSLLKNDINAQNWDLEHMRIIIQFESPKNAYQQRNVLHKKYPEYLF